MRVTPAAIGQLLALAALHDVFDDPLGGPAGTLRRRLCVKIARASLGLVVAAEEARAQRLR